MDKKSIVKRKDKFTYLTASEMLDFQMMERTKGDRENKKQEEMKEKRMDEHGGVLVWEIHMLMV